MKKGISLITLIITIIVIIILAAAIILSLSNTNIIDTANEAVIRNDITSLESELKMYALEKYLSEEGDYDLTKLNANSDRAIYDGETIENTTIYDIVKLLDQISYKEDIIIEDGKIKYIGDNSKIKEVLPDEQIKENITNPVISIQNLFPDSIFEFDENVVISVNIIDNEEIISVDLTNKIKLYNESNNIVYTDSDSQIVISEVTGNLTNKQVTITLNANSISQGGVYTLVIEKGIAKNKYNRYDLLDKDVEFYIGDNPPTPSAPQINLSTEEYTNQDILASIIYPEDSVIKQYRFDISDPWIDYTESIIITENKVLYAQGINELGASNESSRSITNIDKELSSGIFSPNSSSEIVNSRTVSFDPSDSGTSGIYRWSYRISTDDGENWGSWSSYIYGDTTSDIILNQSGINKIIADVYDNAGNRIWVRSGSYVIDNTLPSGVFSPNSSSEVVSSRTVSFNPSDEGGSGIYRWSYRISTDDGENWGSWSSYINGDTTSDIILNQGGTNKIIADVYDNAGNRKWVRSGSYIIKTMPTIVVDSPTVAPEHSTITGEEPAYNNPIIPKGFKPVNAVRNAGFVVANWNNLSTNWNKGLVIEDANGNQFVWIPVNRLGTPGEKAEGIVTYNKWCLAGTSYSSNVYDDWDYPPGGIYGSTQITTYGGFYVARYEAGKEGSNIVVSKAKATVWNYINYNDAKSVAENMYTSSAYGVRSGLLTGKMWDTMLDYFHEHDGKTEYELEYNSNSWGNYRYSISPANVAGYGNLQVTGFNDYWRAGNIYDVAGNTVEWISEITVEFSMKRGGQYGASGVNNPASLRLVGYDTDFTKSLSFRVALFIQPE